MKRILIGMLALLLIGATPVLAAGPVTFNVQLTVRQAINITKTADLLFGTVETVAAPTPLTVNAVAGVQGPPGAGSNANAAAFDLTGEASQSALIQLGSPTATITCLACAGTPTLTVTLATSATPFAFDGAGAATVYVGGTVTIDGTTVAGVYTGTGDISVVYQ